MECAAAAGPATEIISVPPSLSGRGEFVLNSALSAKHGFPSQEIGGFLNSVT